MSEQPQKPQMPENKDLKALGALPLMEALPLIMEQYQVSEDDAFELWVNNRPPTGFEDVIRLSPEEYEEYTEELNKTSVYLFSMGGKKKPD